MQYNVGCTFDCKTDKWVAYLTVKMKMGCTFDSPRKI